MLLSGLNSIQFLNQMKGEPSTVIPYPVPKFQSMGAASKVKFLLIVEKMATQLPD
ncbi:hypothetical protein IH601_06515 [Candidatus Bipolaricaulota bacterium]|jgi:hypothetical protein|nr:hypothetical protein [Candidatus Bipolaricaulota bacterium]